jgi:Na+/H+-dicarboxylate symporter
MSQSEHTGFYATWQKWPLYLRIVGGMVLGVGVGLLLGAKAQSLAIPSKLVLRLLGALAPALILAAIVKALMEASFEQGTAGRLIRLLVLNTLVAICVGLGVANLLRPGSWSAELKPLGGDAHKHGAGQPDLLQQFLDNVPQSILGPLTDQGKVIGVIFLAVAFGIALKRHADRPIRNVKDSVDLALDTLVIILHWIIDIVPLAVFGLVASIVGTQGFAPFQALGAFILSVLAGLVVQASYYLLRVRFGTWVKPGALLAGCRDAMVMAFSTGSSTVTMPVTFECLRDRVGLREKSASLGAFVGANFNNDGTALYEAMAALFVSQLLAAQGVGEPLNLTQQVMVVLTSVIASVGAAGIPEAGLVTMTLVFNAVNLPTEYIALLLPVDWFLDRCRTVINVMGDMNVSCMLDGKTQEQRDSAATPASNVAAAEPA